MALNQFTIWEVRGSGGNDFFGGAYYPISNSSVDYSQQNTPQLVIDGIGVSGTITGSSTTVNFGAAYQPTSGDIGNVCNILVGTNCNLGRFQITAVNPGTKSWTFDRTWATGVGLANISSGNLGGAIQTWERFSKDCAAGNTGFFQNPGVTGTGVFMSNNNISRPLMNLVGYNINRTDGGFCSIASPVSGIRFNINSNGYYLANFNIDPSSCVFIAPLIINCTQQLCDNIRIVSNNWPSGINGIINNNNNNAYSRIEISGCKNYGISSVGSCYLANSNISYCSIGIVSLQVPLTVDTCYLSNHTTNAIGISGVFIALTNSLLYNNGQDGLNAFATSTPLVGIIHNNIFANNGNYGINFVGGTGTGPTFMLDNNLYFNNTVGNRNNLDNAIGQFYSYQYNIIDTNSPFIDVTNRNFGLNAVGPSGGNLARSISRQFIPNMPNTNNFPDIGPFDSRHIVRWVGYNGGYY